MCRQNYASMKEIILEKSMSLFWRYGTKSITMDDVARECGASKKTIYQFFKDKNELVFECVKSEINQQDAELQKIQDDAENALQEVIFISQFMKKKIDAVNPGLIFDLQRHHYNAWQLFQCKKDNERLQMIVNNLERGKREELYREEINSLYLAKIRVEQMHLAFDMNVFPPSEFDFKTLHLQLLDHFLHGLVTEKGLALLRYYKNQTLPGL